jgi:HD-GYP domain-containing protein (c-di-GMP phosphodiesterase class II)
MLLVNQTFYLAIFIVLIGLMARFLANRADDRAQFRVIYWPAGLSFLAGSMLSFFLAPWFGKLVLSLANILLLAGVVNISLLFNVWNKGQTKVANFVAGLFFLIASITYIYLVNAGTTQERIHLMNLAIGLMSIWQIITLWHLLSRDKVYQLKILLGVEFIQLGSRIARSILLLAEQNSVSISLYMEDGWGFALRVSSILSIVTICILITNYHLEKLWQEYRRSSHAIQDGMLNSLNALSMVRDNETGNHILRTKNYVLVLARKLKDLGIYQDELSDRAIESIVKAAPLHDIGKVGIPDAILKKPGSLTDEEWLVMKTHAALGRDVLTAAKLKDMKHTHVLDVAIKIAGCHHENWDGSGYPMGLKGEEIPLAAQLMALADTYDALVSARVYKKKWSHKEACDEIIRLKGKRFNPLVVEAFIQEQDQFLRISEIYSD